jgi:DNA-binding NarL/FixJ family response regulator
MSKIKIAIADDYKIFRDGLKVSLSGDENMEVMMEADNGEELLKALETQTPDVIIMDLKMPVMGGIEATQLVKEKYPAIKILIISMYEDEKFISHLMKIGADAYLLKNAEPEQIRHTIYNLKNQVI